MGPRSDERGNKSVPEVFPKGVCLQWGRAQMSAEMSKSSCTVLCGAKSLQWGRAQMSAEMYTGAAGGLSIVSLQWGRAQMSAEIS